MEKQILGAKTEQPKIEQPKVEQPKLRQPKISEVKLPQFLLPILGLFFTLLLIWKGSQIYEGLGKAGQEVKFPAKDVIAQIGKETLFGEDLNYELKVYFPQVLKTKDPVPEEIKNKALDQIVKDSILLQAAADEGVISLNEKVFNNQKKDQRQRNIMINSIEEKINKKLINWVKGEMISIWFKNIYEPKMGLTVARQVTREKMEAIYNDLTAGVLPSLKEAGEVIKNDPALALIDPSYKGNAYLEFEIKQGESFFIDPKVQEEAFKLQVGQLSEILVGQDQNPGGEFYDCNFIVMKILKRELKGYQSVEDWFNQKSKNYEVEIKI